MKALCLNIDSDTESWRLAQEEFTRVGLNVERVSAVVEDNRPLAFNKSVYKAMKIAHLVEDGYPITATGWKNVYDDLLLFEDDVMFDVDDFMSRTYIELMIGQAPSDYLTLHLGCNIIGVDTTVWQMPTPYNEHLARLPNCWQSHATLYSAECVKFILDNFNPNVLDENNMIFDEWLRVNVLSQGRSYVMNPMICYQRPRRSAIWNCDSDYTGCHKQGNEYLKTLV